MRKFIVLFLSLLSLNLLADELVENPYVYASEVGDFSEGLLPIKMSPKWGLVGDEKQKEEINKWGYIDKSGHFVIRPKFSFIDQRGFQFGRANVVYKNRWGTIDSVGRFIIEPVYSDTYTFYNDVAIVLMPLKNDTNYTYYSQNPDDQIKLTSSSIFEKKMIDKEGKTITTPPCLNIEYIGDKMYACTINGLSALMNESGKLLTKPIYNQINKFVNQRSIVVYQDIVNGLGMGVIDTEGNIIEEPKNNINITTGEESYLIRENGKIGFKDKNGRMILEPIYNSAHAYKYNLFVVANDKTWHFINDKKEKISEDEFDNVDDFYDGRARVGKKNFFGKVLYGFINSNGQYLVEPTYTIANPFSEGLAGVCRTSIVGDQFCGYINTEGKEIIPLKYAHVASFQSGIAKVGERAAVGKNNAISVYIDKNGKEFFRSDKAINFQSFSSAYSDIFIGKFDEDGYAKLQQNGQWGIINREGKIVIPPQYQNIGIFHRGIIKASKVGGGIVFLDDKNNIVLPK
jgi:hypothetical protein